MVEAFGFTGKCSDWVASLDEACEALLAEATGVVAVGNVTATGPALSKQMFRVGTLMLFDGGFEIWHRNAVMQGELDGRLVTLETEVIEGCTYGRHEQLVEWCVFGSDDAPLVNVMIRPGGDLETDRVDAALHAWMRHQRLPVSAPLAEASSEAGSARFSRMRDLAMGRVETTTDLASAAAGQVRARTKETVDTLTLREFRDAIDAAMGQVVEVIAVHEAEISRLQQRERELTEELAALKQSGASS